MKPDESGRQAVQVVPAPPGTRLAWALKEPDGVRYLWLEPCRFFVLYNTASLVPLTGKGEVAQWYGDWMDSANDTFVGIIFNDMDGDAINAAFREFVTKHDGPEAGRAARSHIRPRKAIEVIP